MYRKTEQMTEGRSLYIQLHDSKYDGSPCKLSSNKGFWVVTDTCHEHLRAATPSESPSSVKWQYYDSDKTLCPVSHLILLRA